MSELKPCPFCGELPTKHRKYSEVDCRVWLCPLQSIVVPISQWNTRPIEDQLRAELEDAKDKLRQCALSWKDINSERIDLRQALETWKQSAKMWRDSATYGDRWHSDDLGCDYIGDYKLYRLLRRGGE